MKHTHTSNILYYLVGSNGLSQDTADTLSVVDLLDGGNVNVTINTPISTPRVLDNESFEDTDLLVADSQDTVIKSSTTTSGEDTGLVELEGRLISFDGNRDGSVNQSSLELISALGGDEFVTSVDLISLLGVITALAISSSVGIVRFSFETVGGSVFHSLVHPTTLASVISGVAIKDLLFREREELTSLDEVETFESTGGRERPARAALSLILDGGNSTLVSPINGVGEGSKGTRSSQRGSGGSNLFSTEETGSIDGLEFSFSQVSELVDGKSDTGVFSIESLDLVEVFNEDTESHDFLRSRVGLLVLVLPGRPHGGKGISLESSTGETSESEEDNDKDSLVHF